MWRSRRSWSTARAAAKEKIRTERVRGRCGRPECDGERHAAADAGAVQPAAPKRVAQHVGERKCGKDPAVLFGREPAIRENRGSEQGQRIAVDVADERAQQHRRGGSPQAHGVAQSAPAPVRHGSCGASCQAGEFAHGEELVAFLDPAGQQPLERSQRGGDVRVMTELPAVVKTEDGAGADARSHMGDDAIGIERIIARQHRPGDVRESQFAQHAAHAEPAHAIGGAEQARRRAGKGGEGLLARSDFSRMNCGPRSQKPRWRSEWLPISWPSSTQRRTRRGSRRCGARAGRRWRARGRCGGGRAGRGVDSLGPSSKVSAMARPRGVWPAPDGSGENSCARRARAAPQASDARAGQQPLPAASASHRRESTTRPPGRPDAAKPRAAAGGRAGLRAGQPEERSGASETLRRHVQAKIDHAAGVAPLVVVPGHDLGEVAVEHLGHQAVDDVEELGFLSMSEETTGSMVKARMPFSSPSAAAFSASLILLGGGVGLQHEPPGRRR